MPMNKALVWVVDYDGDHGKVMHADLLRIRFTITFFNGQFFLTRYIGGDNGTKTGPYSTPWAAMGKAENEVFASLIAAIAHDSEGT